MCSRPQFFGRQLVTRLPQRKEGLACRWQYYETKTLVENENNSSHILHEAISPNRGNARRPLIDQFIRRLEIIFSCRRGISDQTDITYAIRYCLVFSTGGYENYSFHFWTTFSFHSAAIDRLTLPLGQTET